MIIRGVSGRNGRVIALVLFLSFVVVPGVGTAQQDGFVDLGVGLSYTLADGSTDVDVGDNVDFTLEITNHGDVTAEDVRGGIDFPIGYVIVDHPAGCFRDDADIFVACDINPLAPGETTDITITGQATETGTFEIDGGALINPSNPFSETDPQDNNFEFLFVSVDEGEEPSPTADLSVTKQGPEKAGVGKDITYVIEATNNGPDATIVAGMSDVFKLADTGREPDFGDVTVLSVSGTPQRSCIVSTGQFTQEVLCTIAVLEPGETFTLTVVVSSEVGTLTNEVDVFDLVTEDPNEANNAAQVTTLIVETADVSVTKEGPDSAEVGEEFVYTIEVTNNGPGEASGIAFDDEIPLAEINNVTSTDLDCEVAGSGGIDVASCSTTGLGSGETATASISVTPLSVGTIRNVVEVTTNSFDPDLSNNIDEAPRVMVGNPGSGGSDNPFLDASNNPLSRLDVIGRVVEWNLNGSIDGIPLTRRDIIGFVVEWNIANAG